MSLTRIVQLACLCIAGYLFVSITGIGSKVPALPPIVDAAGPVRDQVVLPTAKVVIISNPVPAPVITYVTATPAVNNIPIESVEIIYPTVQPYKECTSAQWKAGEPGCTKITDAVDEIQQNGPTPLPLHLGQERICTNAEWSKLAQENYPNPSGCTKVVN